jgi:carboxymethylenebutenolidase
MTMAPPTRVKAGSILCPNGMPAFYARPTDEVDFPCVILLHERYGLVKHTRELVSRCAKDGFFVLAPDLFFQHPDKDALNKGDARCTLGDDDAVALLDSAIAGMRETEGADVSRLAIAGYCQTGRYPLVFGARYKIDAAVVWYGAAAKREWEVTERQPTPLSDIIAALPCPVYGAFGAEDHIIAIDDVRRFRTALEDERKSYEIRLFDNAPHGFLNDTMPGRYRRHESVKAWDAQQEFLRRIFSGAYPKDKVSWHFEVISRPDYDFEKNVRQA